VSAVVKLVPIYLHTHICWGINVKILYNYSTHFHIWQTMYYYHYYKVNYKIKYKHYKNPKTGAVPAQMAMEGNEERWWGAVDKVVVVVRLCVCERERWGSRNPKTERGDSVSGVPCEMVVWGNDRRLLVQVNGIDAAGGLRVRQRAAGGLGLGQKPETKHSWLSFSHAA
jgi:hypothetical protein